MVKQRNLYQVIQRLQEKGIEAWAILDEGRRQVRLGVVNRGEVEIPDRLLEKADDLFEALLRWAYGHLTTISSEAKTTFGPGTFPEDGWTEREQAWLEFQAWLVFRGVYDEDLVPLDEPLGL